MRPSGSAWFLVIWFGKRSASATLAAAAGATTFGHGHNYVSLSFSRRLLRDLVASVVV